jgi:hypothetical protein
MDLCLVWDMDSQYLKKMVGKIEYNNQSFLMLNDQYVLCFKICF